MGTPREKVRPCNVEWIRSIVQQCKAAGTACFVKQLGSREYCSIPNPEPPPTKTEELNFQRSGFCRTQLTDGSVLWQKLLNLKHPKGGDPSEWPEDLRVRQFPSV